MIGASKKIGEASARQLMRLMHGVSVRVGQGGGAGSASKVYVGNLPSDVTKEVPETEVLTFCVCAFPKLLFARGTPTCLQHLWAKSLTL